MAKQPRAKSKTAKPGAAARPAPPPAKTLMAFTEQGFNALKARRRGSAASKQLDKEGQAFADAVDRLQSDYERLLKRDD